MRLASFCAVALMAGAAMVAGIGCQEVQRHEPSAQELAGMAHGARVVIFPVDARMCDGDDSATDVVKAQQAALRTYAALHRTFTEAGYDVVPWSQVESLRRLDAEKMLVPWTTYYYPILYYQLNADYVVTAKVEVMKRHGEAADKVKMKLYDSREEAPLRIYHWRASPAKAVTPSEQKPTGGKM